MFDVPISERAQRRIEFEGPDLDEPWQIGLITGPSGSGKSTVARRLFPESVAEGSPWPGERAVIDGFGGQSIREITAALTAVGFSSPPSWIRPFRTLSTGEQFRCNLARALLTEGEAPVVFDEFTSVVDRTVARVGSAAVAKAIRSGRLTRRFVAVTCHYDVAEWLAPDWILDMATGESSRRRLRRPEIELSVFRCRRDLWRLFAPHHYLSGGLNPVAQCFVGVWNDQPVAFCATIPLIGRAGFRRVTRLVTLPDYQGVGIGSGLLDTVADFHRGEGHRVGITTSHPAMVAHLKRCKSWRATDVKRTGARNSRRFQGQYRCSAGRAVVSFAYMGGRVDEP